MARANADMDFDGITYINEELLKGTYEKCTFLNCELHEADLSDYSFIDCTFDNCNLSMAKLRNTALKTVVFKNCKLLGLNFSDCKSFQLAMGFDNCNLSLATFFRLKIKGTKFKSCNLREADFSEADCTSSRFDNCDLAGAMFDNTTLEKADLRTAFNYSINPEANRIKQARFSLHGLPGLLHKYDIEVE
jgi:fluoroquinolone resistance protein